MTGLVRPVARDLVASREDSALVDAAHELFAAMLSTCVPRGGG